ncbi:Hypothetical protein D9617_11g009860 [Elsinoe fawcettii]|nr:Hypothetical protein D9617_11g009860 [Elsinoe fawcettii]
MRSIILLLSSLSLATALPVITTIVKAPGVPTAQHLTRRAQNRGNRASPFASVPPIITSPTQPPGPAPQQQTAKTSLPPQSAPQPSSPPSSAGSSTLPSFAAGNSSPPPFSAGSSAPPSPALSSTFSSTSSPSTAASSPRTPASAASTFSNPGTPFSAISEPPSLTNSPTSPDRDALDTPITP